MKWLMLVALVGCNGSETEVQTETDLETWQPPEGGVVHVMTRDDVQLEADLYPASESDRPAVVLLHMIPPSNDRTNWPEAFIDTLVARDWSVVAVDRRGAGGSEGVANEAYQGEKGRYDVEACVLHLQSHGYVGPLGIIGASNGTASMIDYAAWAAGEGLPVPAVHGFMSGGSYTEAQTDMEEVASIPSIFTYPASEASWPEAQQPLDPGSWSFEEYPGSAHGTQLFGGTTVGDDLDAYLVGVLEG